MNILFVSKDLIGGNLAYLLIKEGHNVKLFVDDKKRRNNFENMVPKTTNWKRELKWVGKKGLIIFDDVGYGDIQDDLRDKGYAVFGGGEKSDRLEQDRDYGQKIFKKYGMKTVPLIDFDSLSAAINYIKKNPDYWVIKQNDHHYSKVSSYVGERKDGKDVIDMLKSFSLNPETKNLKISLHQRILGIEIGIGRYFNGNDWIGPIEFNIEYPRFFPGDIGPITSEMGTLAWYSKNEKNRLYLDTISKLKPFLQSINFKGDFEINCIVNEDGIYPLEATTRIGSPIVHLHTALHLSPWGELLDAIARGKKYDLKWKKGVGIVVLGAVPPFPYPENGGQSIMKGVKIYLNNCTEGDLQNIHFEEVSKINNNEYCISDSRGYILYVTAVAKNIIMAHKNVYCLLRKLCIPKLFYRNDIGLSFISNGKKLRKWGYL